jgi:hypothetical protein
MLDALEKGQKLEGYSPYGTNPRPHEMSPASGKMNRFNGALVAWAPQLSKGAHAPVRSLPHEGRKMRIKRKRKS